MKTIFVKKQLCMFWILLFLPQSTASAAPATDKGQANDKGQTSSEAAPPAAAAPGRVMTVNQFQLNCWPRDKPIPTNRNILVALTELVEKSQLKTGNGPIVIHCQ